MAKNAPTMMVIPILFFLLIFLCIAISSESYKFHNLKETHIFFYMHDHESGPDVSAIMVAGQPGKPFSPLDFGGVFVADDRMTETADYNSTEIGRARGIYVNSALDGKSDSEILFSLVFTNKAFNGSTLQIQGSFSNLEVSVVSGTGKFRLARGFANFQTVSIDSNFNSIFKWNVTVFHY